MPSPFPGMDPFIEGQKWQDFHTSYVTVLRELLMPNVRPNYDVSVEEYVYIVDENNKSVTGLIRPDVSLSDQDHLIPFGNSFDRSQTAVMAEPITCTIPMPTHVRQKFLTIRTTDYHELVTVIELLSPTNKSAGKGIDAYLVKRDNILESSWVNLVELDLLRGGTRLPTNETLVGDYFAFVCRPDLLPRVDVYPWLLPARLPKISIPLRVGDDDVALDLQEALNLTYDRAGYDYTLDYKREPTPPFTEEDRGWANKLLEPQTN